MQKFGHTICWFQIGRRYIDHPMRDWAAAAAAMARASDNQTVINRIMLRYRPIAPKPVGGEAASGAAEHGGGAAAAGRRVKRKYVRVRGRQSKQCGKRNNITEGKKASPPEKSGLDDESPAAEREVMTLQLLGERSESDKYSCESSVRKSEENWGIDRCNDEVDYYKAAAEDSGGGAAELRSVGSVIETWIIVESVTDKFTEVGLGFSDKERIRNLEHDTCPGFVSDWTNNVIWVNEAYKRMVAADDDEAAAAVAEEKGFLVWLVVKEELPHICPSFACRVRVTQQKGQGQKWNKIVPCDVWRMEFAGFAWKLDVNTALSLGF